MTQTDVVIATVQAGGHWTPDDVASKTGIAKPTVRTILSRAVETGKLRRLERGVYAAATTEVPWHTPAPFALMFEGVETGDGRLIDPAATLWDPDEEQWPHQWAARNEGGHLGAELAGAIRRFRRGGISEHGIRMPASGVLYTDTEAGADYEAHLRRGAPAGVSVDLDDISFEIVDKAGGEPVELLVASASVLHVPGEGWRITTPEAAEIVAAAGGETAGLVASAGDPDDGIGEVVYSEQAGDVVMRITSARFRGATGVALPAFDKARIVLGEDPEQAAVVDDTPEPAEVTAAVVGDVDLPIHEDRDEPWDGPAAGSRVLEWAQRGDADDEEIAARLSRAFLWRNDSANPATLSAYRLGVADVFGDELHIVPRGVFATAGSRGVDALVGVSEEDRERLRTRVCGLYERINEAFPDDEQLECRWRRDDDMGQQVEAAAFGDSAMLALIPADPDALTVEGGDAAGEMHVTLAFLGDAAGLSEEAVQVARDAAAAAAEAHGPLEARVAGIGTLGSEDPPATVLLLNGADMDQAREAVWAQLADFGWEAFAEQHQPWLPHLTVGYGVAPDTVTAPEVIRLDRVRLAMGDQVTDFPLAVHRDEDRDRDDEMAELEASAWQEFQQLPPMPAPWFGEPTEAELPPDSGGVRYDGGRIFGWVVQDGVPHQGYPGKNLTLDKLLPLDTSEFLRQTFQLDDGTTAKAGPFTMNVGHHRDGYECETSACQFDDSRTVAGIITVGLNDRGLWFSGAAAPWLSEWDRLVFASCQPSYHLTQNRGGGYKLGAVLSVPVPGHPSRLAAAGVDHETAVRSVRAVVERSNLALTASTQTTGPTEPAGPVWEVKAKVVPVIDWDQANTDPGGSRLMELLASAVVDEMERRGRAEAEARAEIEALRAELGLEAVEEKTEEQTVKVGG